MSPQLQMPYLVEPEAYDFTLMDLHFRKSSTPVPEKWHLRLEDVARSFGKGDVFPDPFTSPPSLLRCIKHAPLLVLSTSLNSLPQPLV